MSDKTVRKVLRLASEYQIKWEDGGDAAAFVSLVLEEFTKHRWLVFDYMIEKRLRRYCCDPWGDDTQTTHFNEISGINGTIEHKGRLFLVVQQAGRGGMGGMDEGSPDSVVVTVLGKP